MEKPHSYDRFRELSKKRMDGTITPEEADELALWLNEDDGHALEVPASFASSRSAHEKRMLLGIEERIGRVVPMRKRLLWAASAAAVLLFLLTGGYFLLRPAKSAYSAATPRIYPENDRLPASNKAVLTLGNGKQIVLDSTMTGPLVNVDGLLPIKLDDGRLIYTAHEPSVAVQFNTLSTPRGGQIRLSLPDGSEVWLNAASTLKYPTAFTGKDRVVELEGQAYFEVAKNAAQPFKVKAGKMEVKVLGTHFDVMAYADESSINTTLVEGSVQVSEGNNMKLLRPRQQAVVNSLQGTIAVQPVNVDNVLAWKNNMFIFNNASFGTILREIGRWYDVDIVNKAGNNDELFGGSISRKKNLSDVLKLLGAYGLHHYTIEGQKVTILP